MNGAPSLGADDGGRFERSYTKASISLSKLDHPVRHVATNSAAFLARFFALDVRQF